MMSNDYASVKNHIEEIRQAAEHQHLVRTLRRQSQLQGKYLQMLDWVGGKLIAWGERLHTNSRPSQSSSC